MMTEGFFQYVCKDCGKVHLIPSYKIADFAKEHGNTGKCSGREISEYLKGYKIMISCPESKGICKKENQYPFTDFSFVIGTRGDDIWYGSPEIGKDLRIIKK